MKNPRIYEVAKELGISSQKLREKLAEDGHIVKNNFNAVGPELLAFIRENYTGLSEDVKVEKKTENDAKKGIKIEETSSDLKPKQFVVRRVKKSDADKKKEDDKIAKEQAELDLKDKKEKAGEDKAFKDSEKEEALKLEEERKLAEEKKQEEIKKAKELEEERLKEQKRIEEMAKKKLQAEEEARKKLEEEEAKRAKEKAEKLAKKNPNAKEDAEEGKKASGKKAKKQAGKKDRIEEEEIKVGKSKKKIKKKEKRKGSHRNIIDESMRAELEKTDLNFGKKTLSKKKKKRAKRNEEVFVEEVLEQESMVADKAILKARMTVGDFAEIINVKANDIILKLMNLGIMATINQYIDFEVMELIAEEFNIEVELEEEKVDEAILDYDFDDHEDDLSHRAPVVTVMGHVDHGKTSLLDAIRSTSVIEKEAGGITQHIGASEVKINGKKIVFLDTPGHEAFTSLRARGVQLTDIAILVVAADDGVMPQTIEAIDHAKAADVPIIVAINKIDKPDANPDRVIKELSEHGVLLEEWGGDVVGVKVSAKHNQNIDSLLEMVTLVAEMMDLKANPDRNALGTVIEAHLDKGRGPVATVLVQNGTLRVTDAFVCGTTYGRIRAMYSDKGKRIKHAGPSTAVEIIGMSEVPMAGDRFFAVNSDKEARKIAEERELARKAEELEKSAGKVSLEDLFTQIQAGKLKTLNLIIKADVHGSIEAIKQSLAKLKSDEVKINIQHANIGAITESDIMLATASNTIILGFNVRPSSSVIEMAKKENVEIKTYRVIYELIQDVEAALTGMLAPKYQEKQVGEVEVRTTFKVPDVGTIAGAYVLSGKVLRKSDVRLLRNGVIIFEGKLSSLKRFKDDVKEVASGYECGIGIEGFNDIKDGDIIEAYEIEEIKQTL